MTVAHPCRGLPDREQTRPLGCHQPMAGRLTCSSTKAKKAFVQPDRHDCVEGSGALQDEARDMAVSGRPSTAGAGESLAT